MPSGHLARENSLEKCMQQFENKKFKRSHLLARLIALPSQMAMAQLGDLATIESMRDRGGDQRASERARLPISLRLN